MSGMRLFDKTGMGIVPEYDLGHELVARYKCIVMFGIGIGRTHGQHLPVAGIQRIVAIVAKKEVAILRNLEVHGRLRFHLLLQIRFIEGLVRTVDINLAVNDINGIAGKAYKSLHIIDFLVERIAEYDDVSALRLREQIGKP